MIRVRLTQGAIELSRLRQRPFLLVSASVQTEKGVGKTVNIQPRLFVPAKASSDFFGVVIARVHFIAHSLQSSC